MGGWTSRENTAGVVTHAVARSLRDRDGRKRPSLHERSASPSLAGREAGEIRKGDEGHHNGIGFVLARGRNGGLGEFLALGICLFGSFAGFECDIA